MTQPDNKGQRPAHHRPPVQQASGAPQGAPLVFLDSWVKEEVREAVVRLPDGSLEKVRVIP